jgi:tungstate transport system substrate-binding protein
MGAALNMAATTNAYVLSDRATWIHFGNKGDLQIVVQGDKRLFNQYGVMLVNPEKHPNVKKALGQQFIDYLISPEGQRDIANYKIDGQQLFFPNAGQPGARLEPARGHSLAATIVRGGDDL